MTDARQLHPRTRTAPAEWELTDGGNVIGWIRARPRSRSGTFYVAFGVHPETGEVHHLELSADFADRVRTVEKFRADPASSPHSRITTRAKFEMGGWR